MKKLITIAALAALIFFSASATAARHDHLTLAISLEPARLGPGDTAWLKLEFELDPEWHLYWRNPGDSGEAPRVKLATESSAFQVGDPLFPTPIKIPVGPLMNFGFENRLRLLVPVTATNETRGDRLRGKVTWLVCKVECLPGSEAFDLSLKRSVDPVAPSAATLALREEAEARRRASTPEWSGQLRLENGKLHVELPANPGFDGAVNRLDWFPDEPLQIVHAAPIERRTTPTGGLALSTLADPNVNQALERVRGIVAWGDGNTRRHLAFEATRTGPSAASVTAQSSPLGLLAAVGLAFAGGLLLNLMPCVFPVLSIKILGFAHQAHGESRRLRWHGWSFTLGVISSFWALAAVLLALRLGGASLGWGFQLQSPAIVAGLALVFHLLALSLFGFFDFGDRLTGVGARATSGGGYGASFFSGALAVVVATPCTAPLMGPAIASALAHGAGGAFAIFTSLATGLALPYLLLSHWPAGLKRLPRPGAWMETLKQALAFPLLLTIVWLVWVLDLQAGAAAVAALGTGLVTATFFIWIGRRFPRADRAAKLALVAALGLVPFFVRQTAEAPRATAHGPGSWAPFTEAAVSAAVSAGDPVFIDFTAAWCITCQVNKRLVLSRPEAEALFASRGVRRFRADWTNHDETIARALAKYGRNSIPLYVFYPGKGVTSPRLLPEILTPAILRDALVDPSTPPSSSSPQPQGGFSP